MKQNALTAACALAVAAMSGNAYALSAFDAPDLDIYLAGASAPQNSLGNIAAELFSPGYFTFYDDGGTFTSASTSDDGVNYRAYFGVVKAGPLVPAGLVGKSVMLQDRAKGGSVFGVNPIATGQAIANMKVDAGHCVATAGAANYACNAVGDDNVTANPNNRVPDFGVSDVEPKMFKAPYNVEPVGSGVFAGVQLTSSDLAKLTVKPTNEVIFGVPVTNGVPTSTYLSHVAVTGLLSGDVQDWNAVDSTLSGSVVVCRRVQGSGTQASYNNYFLHFPCETNALGGSGQLTPTTAQSSASFQLGTATGSGTPADPYVYDSADGYTVVENGASGAVRTCLNTANTGGVVNFVGGDGLSYRVTLHAGDKAVGTLSLDSLGKEAGNWSFRSMDGIDPTIVDGNNVSNGARDLNYDFVMEQSMQYNTVAYAGFSTNKKSFIDTFIKASGTPSILNGMAANVQKSVLAVPGLYGNVPGTTATGDRVMKGTRNANSCQPIQKLY